MTGISQFRTVAALHAALGLLPVTMPATRCNRLIPPVPKSKADGSNPVGRFNWALIVNKRLLFAFEPSIGQRL